MWSQVRHGCRRSELRATSRFVDTPPAQAYYPVGSPLASRSDYREQVPRLMSSPAADGLQSLLVAPDPEARDAAWSAFLEEHSRLILHVARSLSRDDDAVMDRYAFVIAALRADDFRRLRAYLADGRGGAKLSVMDRRSEVKTVAAGGGATARFMVLGSAAGAAAVLFSLWRLQWSQLDGSFAALAAIAVGVGARAVVRIPRVKGEVTATDTFIFLTMMLYDGEAAILLAVVEALCSSLRITKRRLTVLFNASNMGCSTFVTVWAARAVFGHIPDVVNKEFTARSVGFVCAVALVQYASNSALAAVREALRDSKPVWQTWRESYLWISITTLSAASAAMIIARLINATGFYSVVLILPIVAVVLFTYRTYLKNVDRKS